MSDKVKISRRDWLKSAGLATVGLAAGQSGIARAQPSNPPPQKDVLEFFNEDEAKFIHAAVDRLIPADEHWGGAVDAGVVFYIDRQLASAYGAGAKMYLDGPWNPDGPAAQGYQLKYTPAQLYRVAISEIRPAVAKAHQGKELWQLQPKDIDQVLADLEYEKIRLPSVPSTVFFETLLANTIEGFFSDPAYGGNRNMVAWQMVGFPGAFAQYAELVDKHGFDFTRPPIGIANADAVLKSEHS